MLPGLSSEKSAGGNDALVLMTNVERFITVTKKGREATDELRRGIKPQFDRACVASSCCGVIESPVRFVGSMGAAAC